MVKKTSEFELIEKIKAQFGAESGPAFMGIGDDCSVQSLDEENFQLKSTDLLVENIHFLREKISAKQLGAKSLAVNISDIAAMGGRAESFYLSVGIPADLKQEYVDEFLEGLNEAARDYQVHLHGGDTTKSPGPLIINILVEGKVNRNHLKLRSTAKAGNLICVTSTLGDSGIGLGIVQDKWSTDHDDFFLQRHLKPRAQQKQGIWLGGQESVQAMMDVSDGVGSDLKRICENSKCGAILDLDKLPLSTKAKEFFHSHPKLNIDQICLGSGEDYCLLFCLEASEVEPIKKRYEQHFNEKFYVIGEIKDGSGITYLQNDKEVKKEFLGFDHFS